MSSQKGRKCPWMAKVNPTKKGTFKKGHKTNVGRKHSPEFGERLSKARKGVKRPEGLMKRIAEIIRKKGSLKGEKNPNWKGGITSKNKLIRNSEQYKIWRIKVFLRDIFTCQECGINRIHLQAHHIKSFAEHPELRFDVSNGLTLCKPCHRKTKNFGVNIR